MPSEFFSSSESNRFYLIDYPGKGYLSVCERIKNTSNCFYIFGENDKTPTYGDAARHWIIPDREERHRIILAYIQFLQWALPYKQRLSVYTQDSLLHARIRHLFPEKGPLDFFDVFCIQNYRRTETFKNTDYLPLSCSPQIATPPFSRLILSWRREDSTITHLGELNIQHDTSTAEMTLRYFFQGTENIVHQRFNYFFYPFKQHSIFLLNGVDASYIQKGKSYRYGFDHFDFQFQQDEDGKWIAQTPYQTEGYFFGSRGFGDVTIEFME